MADPASVDLFEARLPEMLSDIERLVHCESPSTDLDAVTRCAGIVAEVGTRLLTVPPEVLVIEGRTHVRWRLGPGPTRVLLLGHHDTVWPVGSLSTHPFVARDGVVRGPGCFDMKAGLVMALHAVATLPDPRGVALLFTGDEEIGSPTSRDLIESTARGCAAVLVLEASGHAGALKCERKGVSLYQVNITGRSAHAGLEPENGVNSAVELAHQIHAVGSLAAPVLGTTVTPTASTAGTAANTVPAAGSFAVDVRVRTADEQHRVDAAMRALVPVLPGARIHVTGGPNRPPMAAESSGSLFDRAAGLARLIGIEPLTGAAVGGASDGNFTAGLGIPTLDGLGAVGGGAHADDEHVVVGQLPGRTALVAALVDDLLGGSGD
jgi:glutamate carboxypeptidase